MHRKPILYFLFVTSALSILYPSPKANAMLFKSDIFISDSAGAGWDTWGCFHNGTYYLYYQIKENATYGQGFGVASSSDGVHWTDHGWAIHESDKNTYYCGSGSIWKSADYDTSGKFICNYSEHRQVDGKRTQNILFAWSTDFIHWTKYDDKTVFKVDTRYFIEHGRWDCISTFPRAEGGYWGTWTASGKEVKGTVGIGYSEDGLHWITLPPPVIEPGVSESGGMYSIEGRIHAMFGESGMRAYSADSIKGPFKVAKKNVLLLGRGQSYFCRFLPTPHGLLVNHHVLSGYCLQRDARTGRRRDVTYVAPLKLAEVDYEGILRWKYWKGNDTLKGKPVAVKSVDSGLFQMVTDELDLLKGLVIEGTVTLPKQTAPPCSFLFQAHGRNYVVRLLHDGQVEMGQVEANGQGFESVHKANRQWEFGKTVSVKILLRAGMMEVYLDDYFMECWRMDCYGAPTVSLGFVDSAAQIAALKVWQMSLEPTNAAVMSPPYKIKAVTVSSQQDDKYAAKFLVDGKFNSRWSSAAPHEKQEWIQFDLGEEKRIGRVVIRWNSAYAKAYTIQISRDAESWKQIMDEDNGMGRIETNSEFEPGTGRYLRLNMVKPASKKGFSIHEIEVSEK